MANRALKFPPMATNQGLAIGSGVASGINNAVQGYYQRQRMQQQMDIQRMHMQALNANSQSMLELRKRQTEAMELHNQGSTMDRMMIINSGGRLNDTNKGVVKDMMDARLQQLPEEQRPAAAASMMSQYSAGRTPNEVLQGMNMGPSEVTAFSKANATSASLQRSQNTLQGNMYKADSNFAGVQYRMDNRANMILSPQDKATMSDYSHQINKLHDASVSLDKPPAFGTLPLSDDAKSHLRDTYNQQINDLVSKRSQVGVKQPGSPAAGNPATPQPSQATGTPGSIAGGGGAPPSPSLSPIKVTSPDQIPQTPGAKWINPSGTPMVTSKAPDGSIIHIPDPGVASPSAPTPQAPPISPSAGVPAGQ